MTPDALAALHAKAFPDARAWAADEFAALLTQRGTRVIGDARAFVLIRTIADEAEILTLATDPAHRRQGLARAVLTKAETQAKADGAATMFLEVAEDNSPAQALYLQAGYAQVGRRPNYYLPKNAAPVSALVLRKPLAAK